MYVHVRVLPSFQQPTGAEVARSRKQHVWIDLGVAIIITNTNTSTITITITIRSGTFTEAARLILAIVYPPLK